MAIMFYKMNYVQDTKAAALPPPSHQTLPVKTAARYQQPRKPSKHPRPLDAEDLSRRLYVVLAEQKAHAERKHRARAVVEAEKQAKAAAKARNTENAKTAVTSHAHSRQHRQGGIPLRPSAGNKVKEKARSVPTLKVQTKDTNHHLLQEAAAEPAKKEKVEQTAAKTSEGPSNRNSEDLSPSSYRHIPQVAASQFTRTTTVETGTDKHTVHMLSRHAMKFHMEGPSGTHAAAAETTPFEQNRAMRQAQILREKQYERNQFQNTQSLSGNSDVDEKGQSTSPHTMHEYLKSKGLDPDEQLKALRRRSTGSMLGRVAPAIPETAEMPNLSPTEQYLAADNYEVVVPVHPEEHRVDWTQSDEVANLQKHTTAPHSMRKSESRWALRSRFSGLGKQSKVDKALSPVEGDENLSPIDGAKSPTKSGFFARFKR